MKRLLLFIIPSSRSPARCGEQVRFFFIKKYVAIAIDAKTIADELMMIGRTQLLRMEGLAFLNPAEDHEMLFDPVTVKYLLQSILEI